MSLIAPQQDYKKYDTIQPSYKMTKIMPQQAIPAAPNTLINATGGTETTILLPVVAMNLSRSILHFTMLLPRLVVPHSIIYIRMRCQHFNKSNFLILKV